MEVVRRRAPRIAEAGIRGGWAGLYEMTPDHNAIIGEAAGVSRFLYATGFSGHGFLQGPAVGEVLRDLVLRRATFVDIAPLSVERFDAAALRPEYNVVLGQMPVTDTLSATATGATRLVEMLGQLGVRLVFGLPGRSQPRDLEGAGRVGHPARRRAARAVRGVRRGRIRARDRTARRGARDHRAWRSQHARRDRRGDGLGIPGADDRHRYCDGASPRGRLPRGRCTRRVIRRRCSGP